MFYGKFAIFLALAVLVSCVHPRDRNIRTESDKKQVLFTFTGKAQSVCLSGDFNDWSPDSCCLEPESGRWKVSVTLSPGLYRYGFFLNGEEWVPDPGAPFQEEDGFGKKNSILVVE